MLACGWMRDSCSAYGDKIRMKKVNGKMKETRLGIQRCLSDWEDWLNITACLFNGTGIKCSALTGKIMITLGSCSTALYKAYLKAEH